MAVTKSRRYFFQPHALLKAQIVILLLIVGSVYTNAQEQKVLRIATPGVPQEVQSKSLYVFKDNLEQQLPDEFDVQVHLNGTLFVQGTEIYALQRNNLEMSLISAQDISKQIPEYTLLTAGYLIRDLQHQRAVFSGSIGSEIYARVADQMNIKILGVQYLGTRQLNLREVRKVNTPEDLSGVKLRMPGSVSWQFLGRALGASPTPMDFNEVYLGLQTGTIDGQDNPLPIMVDAKFYEVTKQIILTNHMVDGVFVAMSKDFWDGLTKTQQQAISSAVDTAITYNNEENVRAELKVQAFLKSKGLTITEPNRDAFRNKVQNAYLESSFSKQWQPGLLERINAVSSIPINGEQD